MHIHRLITWLCVGGLITACGSSEAERGRRLFAGDLPLHASIAGHDLVLPVQASRCTNCHTIESPTAIAAPAASSNQTLGGTLSAAVLSEPIRRRGAPPSTFDEKTLCRLLRTGVDPAHIIIPRSMPRYQISDADCHALWVYLSKTRK
jgi:hypothetical protein